MTFKFVWKSTIVRLAAMWSDIPVLSVWGVQHLRATGEGGFLCRPGTQRRPLHGHVFSPELVYFNMLIHLAFAMNRSPLSHTLSVMNPAQLLGHLTLETCMATTHFTLIQVQCDLSKIS